MTNTTPDPTQPDPNAHSVHEPASFTIQRTAANAEMTMTPCPDCGLLPEVIQWTALGGVVVEPRHTDDCPQLHPEPASPESAMKPQPAPESRKTRRENPSIEDEGR